MSDQARDWKRLLREWHVGAACQLEHARRYVSNYPDRYGGWTVLADALCGLARYREAHTALRTAARLAPLRLQYCIWEQWGKFYKEKNELATAERWYRKALRAHPSTRGHILLGAVFAKQGRHAAAKVEHLAAIRLATPTEPVDEAHYNLALILRAEEKYKQALVHLKKALSIDPHYKLAREDLRDVQRVIKFLGPESKGRKRTPSRKRSAQSRRARPD